MVKDWSPELEDRIPTRLGYWIAVFQGIVRIVNSERWGL
jgi:hypothetical protein